MRNCEKFGVTRLYVCGIWSRSVVGFKRNEKKHNKLEEQHLVQ